MSATTGRYDALTQRFPLRPIRTEAQLDKANRIAGDLAVKEKRTREEEDYLEVLCDLIEKYEERNHPVPLVSGRDALEFLIEENGLTLSQLAEETGIHVSTLSELVTGKRRFSVTHITKLGERFRVDPSLFLQSGSNEGKMAM